MKEWSCLITRGNNRGGFRIVVASITIGVLTILVPPACWGGEEVHEVSVDRVTPETPRASLAVGERLSYHGRWFGLPVGQGWIEVVKQTELGGRLVYQIEASGSSNEVLSVFCPIRDTIRSYLDAETLQPIRFEKDQQEGHYRAKEVVTFDYAQCIATYRSLLNQSIKEIPLPPDVQDLISAFYWLRTHAVSLTEPTRLPIYSDEKIYQVEIVPIKTLQLELLKRGTFPCVLIEPKANFKGVFIRRGRVWCYISTDARRIPLFIRLTTPWGPISGVIDQASLTPNDQFHSSPSS